MLQVSEQLLYGHSSALEFMKTGLANLVHELVCGLLINPHPRVTTTDAFGKFLELWPFVDILVRLLVASVLFDLARNAFAPGGYHTSAPSATTFVLCGTSVVGHGARCCRRRRRTPPSGSAPSYARSSSLESLVGWRSSCRHQKTSFLVSGSVSPSRLHLISDAFGGGWV